MPPAQRLVQSGFYEVALTPAFEASLCHATSQNPQDSANFSPPLARPAGRLGKQIARLACGPGGLSQWDASGLPWGLRDAMFSSLVDDVFV
jgi:hypothetical protein